MPLLSVLTAVHLAGSGFLAETRASVLSLQLPPDWDLEWVVQEDGPASGEIGEALSGDDRIKHAANGTSLGAATTRNLALARVSGALVQNLDADDLLLPGSAATLITALTAQVSAHWAVGQADDLLPDGSRKSFPPDLPFGLVPAGQANDWAAQHGGNWPIHCAGVMYRTASVRALGGWVAVPFDEDLIMFAALSEVTDGWFDESLTWLYRQHDAQLVRSEKNEAWSETGRRIAMQRARAVELAALSLSGRGVDAASAVDIAPSRKSAPDLARPTQ